MFSTPPIDGFRNCSTTSVFDSGLFYSLVGDGQVYLFSPGPSAQNYRFAIMIGTCDSLECVTESYDAPLILLTEPGVAYTIFASPGFDFPVTLDFTAKVSLSVVALAN
jgi:hypothetical protein